VAKVCEGWTEDRLPRGAATGPATRSRGGRRPAHRTALLRAPMRVTRAS